MTRRLELDTNIIVALIGIIGGIGGSFIGGSISRKILRTQLEHEAREKERERQLTLRRDIYLETMEAISKSQMLLGSFSREDFSISALLDKMEEIPGALAKSQLVTSEGTFEALDKFNDFMISNVVTLLGLHIRVRHLQSEIEDHRRQISQQQQRHERILAFINEVGPQDQRQSYAISELQNVQEEQASAQAVLEELIDRHVEATKRLGEEAAKSTIDAQMEVGKIIIEMRKELELPLREEWCMERFHERKARLLPKIDEVYKNVDDVFGETEALEASAKLAPPVDSKGHRIMVSKGPDPTTIPGRTLAGGPRSFTS